MPGYDEINWGKAECRGAPTNLFYIVEENRTALQLVNAETLRSVCGACPLVLKCLAYGMQHENYGVWGGLLTKERNAVKMRHNSPLQKQAVQALQDFGISIEQIEAVVNEYQSNERSVENEFTYNGEDDSAGNSRPRERRRG